MSRAELRQRMADLVEALDWRDQRGWPIDVNPDDPHAAAFLTDGELARVVRTLERHLSNATSTARA